MALTRIQITWVAAIAGLLLLIATTYHEVPNNTFVFDDEHNIVELEALHIEELSLDNILLAIEASPSHKIRVLPSISFAIDWWRGNGDPRPFLWTNLIIHGANALMLFFLTHLCLKQVRKETDDYKLIATAFACAALWAVHPIQLQGITYIVQRSTSMASFFMLLSIYGYLHARLGAANKKPWFILSAVAMGLAMICKEIAFITPCIILLAEYSFCRNNTALVKNRFDPWIMAIPLFILIYIIIDLVSGSGPLTTLIKAGYDARSFSLEERLLTQPRVILFYLSQVLWPLPERFSIEHDFLISKTLLSPTTTLFSLAGILLWCGLGLWALFTQGKRYIGFFMLWLPTALIIESSILPLEIVYEHRMYFPSTVLFILLAYGILTLLHKQNISPYIVWFSVGIIIVLLSYSTMQRVPLWQSQLMLYKHALKLAPESKRANYNYARNLFLDHRYKEAATHFKIALKMKVIDSLYAFNSAIHYNLGLTLHKLGDFSGGEKHYKKAIYDDNAPHTDAHFALAHLYSTQKMYRESLSELERFLTLKPDHILGNVNIGSLYGRTGNKQKEKYHYEKAIELNSLNQKTYTDIGIKLSEQGRYRDGLTYFKRGLSLNKNNADLYNNIGGNLFLLGEINEAEWYFKKTLELNPTHSQAIQNLQLILENN